MTREETISNLKAYLNGDMAIGNIIPLRSVLESAIRCLETSLPANLDEAAGNYAIEVVPDNFIPDEGNGYKAAYTLPDIKDAFKAGAEWMAGRGVTKDGLVVAYDNGYLRVYTTILDNEDGIKFGDRVIVQIRKK